MITIYSSFRSCDYPRFEQIQRWAANSWIRLQPKPEVIIFGDDKGSKELCEEFGFIYIPDVNKTEHGTPVLKDIILRVDSLASYDNIALVSGDIILFNDVISTLQTVRNRLSDFCIVSHRKDANLQELDFSNPEWEQIAKQNLSPSLRTSGDFFLYPKGFWQNLSDFPPIVTGRGYADSFLFWSASNRGALVEATEALTLVHPNHDHPHVPEGNPEFEYNAQIVNTRSAGLDHANWILNSDLSFTNTRQVTNL